MRIAVLGRTRWLLDASRALVGAGHSLVLVATAAAAPEYGAGLEDFGALAAEAGAPFFADPDIDGEPFAAAVRETCPEVGVSINWPSIIRQGTCQAFPLGILNAHAGDLPRYRGNACPNWAILNGESRIGLCAHRMEPGAVDSGPIYARRFLPVTDETYIGDVYAWIAAEVPGLFVEAVARLGDPNFLPEEQTRSGVRPLRCHPRRPDDGRIDWNRDANDVLRLVRASSRPFPGAFAWLDGGPKVTIWRAAGATPEHDVLAVPGQIMGRGARGGVLVACGSGVVEIEEAEVAGCGRLPAANRYRLTSWPASPARDSM